MLSVILPVFNNERTILAAVQSILQQSFTDFELIVMNDGSTDGTLGVLDGIADPRLKVMGDHTNQGLPRRLNEALTQCRGKYVARMDADDLAFPDRFQKQVTYLERHLDIDVVAGRAVVFDDQHRIFGLLPFAPDHATITRRPWNNFPMPHPTWMGKRDWFLKYGYALPEIWRAEDQDLLLRSYQSSRFACLPDVVLCYRQGKFQYQKTSIARRHTLKSQLGFFTQHKNYKNAALSVGVFIAKSLFDVAQLFPFISGYYRNKKLSASKIDDDRHKAQQFLDQMEEKLPPHIVFVSNTAASLVRFRGHIISGLMQDGVRVSCLAAPDVETEKTLRDLGVEFYPVSLSRAGVAPFQEIKSVFQLYRILKRISPDLVVSYTIKPNAYVPFLAKFLAIPSLAVVTGLGYAFIQKSLKAKVARTILSTGLSFAKRVWTLNQDDADVLGGYYPFLKSKLHMVAGEGIDTDYFDDRKIQASSYHPQSFLMISRILRDKGIVEYAAAAKLVRQNFPDAIFYLLGDLDMDNPAALSRDEFDTLCRDFPITYLGVATDVRPSIVNAAFSVLPSYREGVPLALLESAALRRPMIATDVAGCKDVVEDGVNGFLVELRSAESLAQAMGKALSLSEDRFYAMKEEARRIVCKKFSAPIILDVYRQTISDMLK